MTKFTIILLLGIISACSVKTGKTLQQYGYTGQASKRDMSALQKYIDENNPVVFGEEIILISRDLFIRGKKKVIIEGTIQGIKSNEKLIVDGDVHIMGIGQLNRAFIKVIGGQCTIEDIKISNAGDIAAILLDNDDKIVEQFRVNGVEIENCNYGIFRQGARGEKKVLSGIINNCYIHDCRGDGIQWNVGYQDGPIAIKNNTIRNLNSDAAKAGRFWGIGIGVAGGRYSDDYKNTTKNFKITDNTVENVRQGIHIETGESFEVKGNKVSINSKLSTKSSLDVAGIVTYGSKDFVIKDNIVVAPEGYAIWNSFGSLPKIGYLAPPKNYEIISNTVTGRVVNWCSGSENTVKVIGNNIKGNLIQYGGATHVLKRNKITSPIGTKALTVDLLRGNRDRRKSYNSQNNAMLKDIKNTAVDEVGNISKEIKGYDQY